ncbi:MAG: GNAT family N-acetyltransferase [Oscillospiraceae bacterium]|nr:GNAT family N-acetyltransferase [Oscillospiraceae bacterium]
MEQVTFRFADQQDIPELCRMRLAYFEDDFGALPEQLLTEINAQLPAYFAEHLGKDCIAPVASLPDGTLCACALLCVETKPANPFFPNGKSGTVLGVFTMPESRHKGYASKVMQMLIDWAKANDLSIVRLSATAEGKCVYEKLGFFVKEHRYTDMELKMR